jgi:O-antigen/teichoic acid export membrane protein
MLRTKNLPFSWLTNSGPTLRHWVHDRDFRQIYQGAGFLICGNGFKFVLGIAAYGMTTRTLGVSEFGVFALIQAYVMLMDRLFNFNTRQTLVKFGAQEVVSGNRLAFQRLFKFLFLIDMGSALGATFIAIGVVYMFADSFGWSREIVPAAILYCTIILFNSTAPGGTLRLFNRFSALTSIAVVSSIVRIAAVFVAYHLETELWGFLMAWAIGDIVERLLLIALGLREMHRRGFNRIFSTKLRGVTYAHKGIRRFLLSSNLESAVRLLSYEVDIFIVAYFLDLYAVGVYKIIKEVVLVIVGIGDTIHQSSYPLIARLWAGQEYGRIRRYLVDMRLIGFICGAVFLVFYYFFGRSVLETIFGTKDAVFFVPLFIALVGPLLWMSQSGYASAMYTLGFATQLLMISLGAGVISVLCHLIFTPRYGLEGAAISFLSSFIVWTICTYVLVNKGLRLQVLHTSEEPSQV